MNVLTPVLNDEQLSHRINSSTKVRFRRRANVDGLNSTQLNASTVRRLKRGLLTLDYSQSFSVPINLVKKISPVEVGKYVEFHRHFCFQIMSLSAFSHNTKEIPLFCQLFFFMID